MRERLALHYVARLFAAAVVFLLIAGPSTAPRACAAGSPLLTPAGAGVRGLVRHPLTDRLVSNKWERAGAVREGQAREMTTWEFYADGACRWRFVSDFAVSNVGAWRLAPLSTNAGLLFIIRRDSHDRTASRSEVLSVWIRNGDVRLGEQIFKAVPFADSDVAPQVSEGDSVRVSPGQEPEHFQLWTALTAHEWRASTAPPSGAPVAYAFMRDGTFLAQAGSTECRYVGTWSLLNTDGTHGDVRLNVPAHECDQRGPRESFIWEQTVSLESTGLLIDKTLYVADKAAVVGSGVK